MCVASLAWRRLVQGVVEPAALERVLDERVTGLYIVHSTGNPRVFDPAIYFEVYRLNLHVFTLLYREKMFYVKYNGTKCWI